MLTSAMSFKGFTELFNKHKKDAPEAAQGLTAWFGRRAPVEKPKERMSELLHGGIAADPQLPSFPEKSSAEVPAAPVNPLTAKIESQRIKAQTTKIESDRLKAQTTKIVSERIKAETTKIESERLKSQTAKLEARPAEPEPIMDDTTEPPFDIAAEAERLPLLPHEEFPAHYQAVMDDLERRGQSPGRWDVIKAREIALTEDGMQVEMMMKNADGEELVFMLVTVSNGKLVSIKVR